MHRLIQVSVVAYIRSSTYLDVATGVCTKTEDLHNHSKRTSQHTLSLVKSSVVGPAIESSRVNAIGTIAVTGDYASVPLFFFFFFFKYPAASAWTVLSN